MSLVYDFLSDDDGLIKNTGTGFLPRTAIVPLKRINQFDFDILIKAGDRVQEGQTIAKNPTASVHSSIPGIVEEIMQIKFQDGSEGAAAKIKLDGSLSYTGRKFSKTEWNNFDSNTILYMLSDKGVINIFEKTRSLSQQIKSLNSERANVLAVRLFSEDPSRLSDSFISEKYFEQIKTGACIVAKAMGAKGIVFAADKNKSVPDASVENLYKCPPDFETGFVLLDGKGYPCGTKHEIVTAIKEKYNSNKQSVLSKIGNRDLFIDAYTALDVYNAIVLGKPVIERIIHITGDCLNAASVMNIKIGMTFEEIARQCGGFKRKPAQIVVNGLVCGVNSSSLETPLTKEVKSISFIPARQVADYTQQLCIRCGECINICPVMLFPESLYRSYLKIDENSDQLKMVRQTSVLCTGCGLCNSVCPSRIPLSQCIEDLKQNILQTINNAGSR